MSEVVIRCSGENRDTLENFLKCVNHDVDYTLFDEGIVVNVESHIKTIFISCDSVKSRESLLQEFLDVTLLPEDIVYLKEYWHAIYTNPYILEKGSGGYFKDVILKELPSKSHRKSPRKFDL